MKINYNECTLERCGTSAIPISYEKVCWEGETELKEYLITFDNGYVLDMDSRTDEEFIKYLIKNKINVYINYTLSIIKDGK